MLVKLSNSNLALQVEDALAGDFDPLAAKLTKQGAAPCRKLLHYQPLFAQLLRSKRDQSAMGRSGDRVFKNASTGGKEVGDKISKGIDYKIAHCLLTGFWRCVLALRIYSQLALLVPRRAEMS